MFGRTHTISSEFTSFAFPYNIIWFWLGLQKCATSENVIRCECHVPQDVKWKLFGKKNLFVWKFDGKSEGINVANFCFFL